MKFKLKLLTIATLVMIQLELMGQNPTGPTTNLCPNTIIHYTSASTDVNGGSCANLGWTCDGCVDNNLKPTTSVIASGVNNDGTLWANVRWGNVASGAIATVCGSLNVSISSIKQPSISGPSIVSLCGSGSITLQATVPSMSNIVGFTWVIDGTGVSPIGTINTTVPQLTLNFTNWTASSTLSATVAVGAKNSCGFTTATSPLKDIDPIPGIPGSGIKAIPRSAWVQLSPGTIDDLLAPLSFSPSVICTSSTISVSNKPANASLVWSSGNSSALSINPTTGFATRLNNFIGSVTVTATLSNACGSTTQNTNVWLGRPDFPTPISGPSELAIDYSGQYKAINVGGSNGTYNWTIQSPWYIYSSGPIATGSAAFVVARSSTLKTLTVTTSNICGTGFSSKSILGTTSCTSSLKVSPNPSKGGNMVLNILPPPGDCGSATYLASNSTSSENSLLIRNERGEEIFSKTFIGSELEIKNLDLKSGVYFINVQSDMYNLTHRLLIH